VLELELGLLGGVLSYDQLLVDGTLSLGGLLRIILTDDYMPSAGDFADLLVADSMASVFASLELIAPGRQISWTVGSSTCRTRGRPGGSRSSRPRPWTSPPCPRW
jgi:hypothetical protein